MNFSNRVRILPALVFSILKLCMALPATAEDKPREINITRDSAPGWLPSEQLEERAQRAMITYLFALANGDVRRAYDMTAPAFRQNHSYANYQELFTKAWANVGSIEQGRVIKITWTKDPQNVQTAIPGVYAAIDIALKTTNVDRHCGYVVVYAADDNAPFSVMREESNMILNSQAEKIVRGQSRAALDKIWSQMVHSCPGGW